MRDTSRKRAVPAGLRQNSCSYHQIGPVPRSYGGCGQRNIGEDGRKPQRGETFSDDIRFLNHMMEKHGFRNPNIDKPDRNQSGY